MVIPALLFIWACLYRFINMEEPDKLNVSLWQVSALAAGCREYREKAGHYPTSGVQIVFFFRDKTHDRIRDAWGNYIEFNTNGSEACIFHLHSNMHPGKPARFQLT